MILGVGIDIVDLAAFRRQLGDGASHFVSGTFTPGEQAASARAAGDVAQRLAARFAAKEAFFKAWGGASRGRPPAATHLDLRDVEVVQDAWGRPSLRLGGLAAQAAEAGGWEVHLSMSHDGGYAAATVMLCRRADAAR